MVSKKVLNCKSEKYIFREFFFHTCFHIDFFLSLSLFVRIDKIRLYLKMPGVHLMPFFSSNKTVNLRLNIFLKTTLSYKNQKKKKEEEGKR